MSEELSRVHEHLCSMARFYLRSQVREAKKATPSLAFSVCLLAGARKIWHMPVAFPSISPDL